MSQWRLGGLQSPGQLFQPPAPASGAAAQPLLSPAQLSSLSRSAPPPPRPSTPAAAPTTPAPALPKMGGADQFAGVSRLLSQQGRLPATPLPLPPQNLAPISALTKPAEINAPVAVRAPLEDTFVFQYGEIGKEGSRMEAQGNCGPASAAIIIQEFGVEAPTMRDLRKEVGAPTGSAKRAYALTTDQVGKAVQETLAEHDVQVEYDVQGLSTNVDRTLNLMREKLAAGEKVILLSSNLASQSRGHYVVVKEVRANGSIVIDDPGRRNGEDDVYSRARLEQTLKTRVNRYKLSNSLITFKTA